MHINLEALKLADPPSLLIHRILVLLPLVINHMVVLEAGPWAAIQGKVVVIMRKRRQVVAIIRAFPCHLGWQVRPHIFRKGH